MNKSVYFVAGIGTGVGKTVASAILCEAIGAHYWKPVQSGELENSDAKEVKSLLTRTDVEIFPEAYKLSQPLSPHASSKLDGIIIDENKLSIPHFNGKLIIEGAGGVLVPLSDDLLYIDMLQKWEASIILISRNYLGSINHTLLTAEALSNRKLQVKGIIFNGKENSETESIILRKTQYAFLGRIDETELVSKEFVFQQAQNLGKW